MVVVGLGTEPGDQVGRNRTPGQDAADRFDAPQIPLARIFPVHQFKHPRTAGLGGQMDRPAEVRITRHGVQHFIAEVFRMRSRKTDPQFRVDRCHGAEQVGKSGNRFPVLPTVRIDILPQEGNFAVTAVEQFARLAQDRLRIAAALRSARVRDHTVRTHVVTTAHNRNVSTHAVLIEPDRRDFGISLLARQQHIDSLRTPSGLAQ